MGQAWLALRRVRSVREFARIISWRHPEIERGALGLREVLTIAGREEVSVDTCDMPRPARLLRYGGVVGIQVSTEVGRDMLPVYVMHEMCHFWRDDPGEACYHRNGYDEIINDDEIFADVFAAHVTATPAQRAGARAALAQVSPLRCGAPAVRGLDFGVF